jgi:prevent-host-death family protein
MTNITSGELKRKFGLYRAIALREPVMLTHHGREDLVMISVEQYRKLQRLARQTFHASEMTDEELADVQQIIIPKDAIAFNHEERAA